MSPFLDAYNHLASWVTGVGIPAAIAYFARRAVLKSRAQRRSENAQADVEQGTVADRIKTSSVTAVEAQMVATTKAFDAERTALLGTIEHQAKQLTDERAYSASRDELIASLRAEVEELRKRLDLVAQSIDNITT